MKLYTAEEVSRHNNGEDLWMVIHGGVFDLTKFLTEHPGGEEPLLDLAGRDGTKCFDDIGHSAEALKLRDDLKIGELTGAFAELDQTATDPQRKESPGNDDDDDNWEYQPPVQKTSPWMPIIIAAGAVIYGAIFYYLW